MSRLIEPPAQTNPPAALQHLDAASRSALIGVAILAPALWLLPVAYALYAMLLLDVALPGHSGETVAGLAAMAIVLVALHAILQRRRQLIMTQFAAACERLGAARPELDCDPLRAMLVGGGADALIDTGGLPLLLAALVLIGGWVAAIALLGIVVTAVLVASAGQPMHSAHDRAEKARRARDVEDAAATARSELVALLGLTRRTAATSVACQQVAAAADMAAADYAARVEGRTWVVAGLAMAIVAAASVSLMGSDASAGSRLAVLLITAFIFRPLLRVAAQVGEIVTGAAGWRVFRQALSRTDVARPLIALPPPARRIEANGLAVPVHGTRRLMLQNLNFVAEAGDVVAVIGPAGVGKSTLLKLLAGHVSAPAGVVRLDGATLDQWDHDSRARHIGYLPQLPDLLPGTVAQNIACFDERASSAGIIGAAMAAGAHDAIVRLPAGYDTMIGALGAPPLALSVQQRIALARALHGEPFLLLLDNPSGFQDGEGDAALRRCLSGARARDAVTIVVGDSAAIIDSANLVLVLRKEGMADFGTKEDVRARMVERQRRDAERLAEVSVTADPRDMSPIRPEPR